MTSRASHSASQPGRRTNSLAFAGMDCHTCASNGHKCDRQRPQCTTCLDQGRKCGGFAMPLSWDERRTWLGQASRNKSLRTAPEEGDDVQGPSAFQHGDTTSPKNNSRNFRFVPNGKKTRKKRKVVQSRKENTPGPVTAVEAATEDCLPALDNLEYIFPRAQQVDPFPELASLAASEQWLDDPGNALYLNDNFDLPSSLDYFATLLPPELSGPSVNNPITMDRDPAESLTGPGGLPADAFPEALAYLVHQSEAPVEGAGVLTTPRSPVTSGGGARLVPSAPMGSQSDALLQMYDSEFCVLPITSDTELNPFRFRQPLSQAPRVLFHSIFALCCRHLSQLTGSWSSEEREHRSQASKLLESALKSDQLARRGLTLLDPILILFTLDCTISASGRWSTHLTRVRSILEACGGSTALNNARLRSQVAMMLWWDATLALVSRQGTVFSQQYLDLIAREEKNDKWSFYDLTGCPSDLVIYIFKLAQLAQQSEIASSMTWLTFDLSPVIEIESQLRTWKHPSFTAPEYSTADNSYDDGERDSESAFHARQDCHHVAEAWRHALLLYIERIFRWDRYRTQPRAIQQLARLTLNHVRCCRRTSQMQKQLLLPVFLAGSETGDEEMQSLVRGYCHWWGKRSRYNMFHSVPVLLEDIWGGSKWWGVVVDEKTKGVIGEGVSMQFLFG